MPNRSPFRIARYWNMVDMGIVLAESIKHDRQCAIGERLIQVL